MELVLTPISLVQLLCTAAVVQALMDLREVHPQAAELTATRQQQTEVAVDHSPLQIVGLHLQEPQVL